MFEDPDLDCSTETAAVESAAQAAFDSASLSCDNSVDTLSIETFCDGNKMEIHLKHRSCDGIAM